MAADRGASVGDDAAGRDATMEAGDEDAMAVNGAGEEAHGEEAASEAAAHDEMAGNAVADLRAMVATAALLRIDCSTTECLRLYRDLGEADCARAGADGDDGHRDDVVPVAVRHADVADEEEVCLR